MSRKRKARDGNTPLLAGVPKRLHCSSPGPDRRSDGSLYIAEWLRYWLLPQSRPCLCLLWFILAPLRRSPTPLATTETLPPIQSISSRLSSARQTCFQTRVFEQGRRRLTSSP
ncbi:hypothetical protein B5807_06861 [Epicoccum nigrum]|uniref:Uncharacterized protein n=1 Tax=Epicoccum nigrum TaxID=105696 RepID=A0A1Y2LYF8_EPING|nr:hypothetical protein B5807_06861 [Epicoccum nigrum]